MRITSSGPLMLALSMLVIESAHAEKWQSVSTNHGDGIEHFVDFDSIRPDGEYVTAWSREKLPKPISRGLFHPAGYERIVQNAFDCKRRAMAMLSLIVRGKDGATLDNVRVAPAEIRFSASVPGSVGEEITRAVCTRFALGEEITAFAADPAHPYFDEVTGDIAVLISAGHSLADAYEKAVWANPTTRQKEIARLEQLKNAQVPEEEAEISFGTAWLSDSGYLVTAYHVIDGASLLSILLPDQTVLRVQVVLTDPVNDLAILSASLPRSGVRGLSLSRAPVSLGTTVFTVGFPHPDMLGVKPKFTLGQISSTAGMADDPRILQISTPVQAGNSGGPLMNQNGDVVGVISAKLSAAAVLEATGDLPQNINYAIKGRYLQGLLADAPSQSFAPSKIQSGTIESIVAQMNDSVFLLIAE